MKKSSAFFLVLVSVCAAFFLSALFGGAMSSRLSTIPLIDKIVGPPAPVMVTTVEQVASPNPQDFSGISDGAKSKISTILATDGSQIKIAGGAINITSDGLFIAPADVFFSATQKYFVLLGDGRMSAITERTADVRAGVVFFRAQLQNVPVISLDDSASLIPGDQVAVLNNSTNSYLTRLYLSQVTEAQTDVERLQFNADKSLRSFAVQPVSTVAGSAIIDVQGNLVGVWDQNEIISSDVLQQSIQKYLNNPSNFSEPQFGFNYVMITPADNQLLGLQEGAQVTFVAKPARESGGSYPAFTAKLQTGDIITQINGLGVNVQNLPEIILEQVKPGDQVSLTVVRGKDTIKLQITAGKE